MNNVANDERGTHNRSHGGELGAQSRRHDLDVTGMPGHLIVSLFVKSRVLKRPIRLDAIMVTILVESQDDMTRTVPVRDAAPRESRTRRICSDLLWKLVQSIYVIATGRLPVQNQDCCATYRADCG